MIMMEPNGSIIEDLTLEFTNTVKNDEPITFSSTEMDESSDNDRLLYFDDGERRIDFILAYQTIQGGTSDAGRAKKVRKYRATYLHNLTSNGLQLEESECSCFRDVRQSSHRKQSVSLSHPSCYDEDERSQDKCSSTHFIKVHAPFETLCDAAEDMKMKVPMRQNDIGIEEWYVNNSVYKWMKRNDPFQLRGRYTREEAVYFVGLFDKSRMSEYINHDKPNIFFSPAERGHLVYSLLEKTRFGPGDVNLGVYNLKQKGVFIDAYPLHEGPVRVNSSAFPKNDRQRLQSDWATVRCIFKYQPIKAIKNYFGEEVALYFSWLGFYTSFLVPAAIIGILCFLYGVIHALISHGSISELCNPVPGVNGTYLFYMCPLCDKVCSYYLLQDIGCMYAKITHFFDNEATLFFSLFMSIWATLFLEFWKRKQISFAYAWHSIDFTEELEQMRPQFAAAVTKLKKNPITLKEEPYMTARARLSRICGTFAVVAFFVTLILIAIIGVIIFRAAFYIILLGNENAEIRRRSKMIVSGTAAVLNLIAINILKLIYEKVAVKLTEWENPRTKSDYKDSFTIKMFWFQFVNTYSSIMYVAFFKGDIVTGTPGNYRRFGKNKFRFDDCSVQGCFLELTIQLIIIMVGQQIIGNIMEVVVPYCKTKYNDWKIRKHKYVSTEPQWVQDFQLEAQTDLSLFWQYLEIVLQYGFVTMFVAAFPLAPFFALLNNIVEIRVDAVNFVYNFRRPVALKAEDIGAWYGILATLTTFSTIVNAFVLSFTSRLVPIMTYQYYKSPDGSSYGFTNYSLSFFNVADFSNLSRPLNATLNGIPPQSYCRYPGYRKPVYPYDRSHDWWVILAARLSFIIAFQAVVLAVTWAIAYIIPDVPKSLHLKIKREEYLASEAEKDHKERIGKRKPRRKDDQAHEDDNANICLI